MTNLLRYASRRRFLDLEGMLSSAIQRADPASDISPVQRAICRVLTGQPLGPLARHPDVLAALGGESPVEALPSCAVDQILILAGIRCGKSLIAAMTAIRATQTCDVSRIGPGETPRVSVLSISKDLAQVTYSHVKGQIEADPTLRVLLIGEPGSDSLQLRHPSGRAIEICVVAGSKAAGSLVGRWMAGVIFDEAPRMDGSEDGAVVNLDDALTGIAGRMLPGAQVIMIGSPWAPFGPVYKIVEDHFRRPSKYRVVFRATANVMNPAYWTPERCEHLRINNPDAYMTDVQGEFMAPEVGLFSPSELREVSREGHADLAPEPGHQYVASIDPATRKNSWTLAISTLCVVDGKPVWTICLVREWIGSVAAPLSPRAVLGEIADILRPYRTNVVITDQYAADFIRDIGYSVGVFFHEVTLTGPVRWELFQSLRARVTDRSLSLPAHDLVHRDLANVRKKVTQAGAGIVLPQTGDGRHCDYAVAIALSLALPIPDPVEIPDHFAFGTPEWYEAEDRKHREKLRAEILAKQKKQARTLFGR